LILFAGSIAQGTTLEYIFHKLDKYRYSIERFLVKVPLREYPPLSVVLGYFWLYFLPFYLSVKISELLNITSQIWMILLMLGLSFIIVLGIDNLLIRLGLWYYVKRRYTIGFVPISVAFTVPAFMTVSLFLAYYSHILFSWYSIALRIVFVIIISVVAGLALCSLRMIKILPNWIRLVSPIGLTFIFLNLWYLISIL
jgi:hypothetical protein